MITITELKRSPTHALNSAGNHPVAIMNHNKVTHYALPAALYERIMDMVEDAQDLRTSVTPVPGAHILVDPLVPQGWMV